MAGLPTGVGLALRWAFLDDLLDDGIPPGIDHLEVNPENYQRRGGFFAEAIDQLCSRIPISTHGLALDLGGADPLDLTYLAALRSLLDRLRVPWHSDHLCFVRSGGRSLHDLFPLPTDRATVSHVADRIARVRDAIGRPLAVENVSHYIRGGPPGASDATFVADVLEAADCGLLLDLNNVLVNAENHGFDPYAWVDAVPLGRVVSIHVAGGERLHTYPDHVIDTHGTDPSDAVLALLAYVLRRTGTVPVVYERDHAIPPLHELVGQLERVRRIVAAAAATCIDESTERDGGESRTAAPPRIELPDLRATMGPWVLERRPGSMSAPPDVAPADLDVYRGLVRTSFAAVVDRFLPRTRAAVGDATFDTSVEAWLHGPASVSPYLRDVPHELGTFLLERWREDPSVPDHACDVLRHELTEPEVEDAFGTDAPPGGATPAAFGLDVRLCFSVSARLTRFSHRVHEPWEDGAPRRGDTVLLWWRDASGDARALELSALGQALVTALMRGETVAASVRAACREVGESAGDTVLARIGTLLADLGARGIATVDGA